MQRGRRHGEIVSFHRLVASAALAGWLACAAPGVAARDAAPLALDSIDVEQVARLGAGVPLHFTVFGTSEARAALRIEGARRLLELRETEPGIYEGTYLIDASDAIRAESRVTATLQKDGRIAASVLDEPLLLARGSAPWSTARVDAAPEPGDAGTAERNDNGAAAPLAPAAPPRSIAVPPRSIAAPPRSIAPPRFVAAAPPARPEPQACLDCAFVESIRTVESSHEGPIAALAGAVAGAVLGDEVGAAHHRRMMSLLGAVGGALVGHEIDVQRTRIGYDVVLRLPDGTRLTRRYEQAPPFAVGATIRLDPPGGAVPASS
jgi:outer membrane lipoprotein SlyB